MRPEKAILFLPVNAFMESAKLNQVFTAFWMPRKPDCILRLGFLGFWVSVSRILNATKTQKNLVSRWVFWVFVLAFLAR